MVTRLELSPEYMTSSISPISPAVTSDMDSFYGPKKETYLIELPATIKDVKAKKEDTMPPLLKRLLGFILRRKDKSKEEINILLSPDTLSNRSTNKRGKNYVKKVKKCRTTGKGIYSNADNDEDEDENFDYLLSNRSFDYFSSFNEVEIEEEDMSSELSPNCVSIFESELSHPYVYSPIVEDIQLQKSCLSSKSSISSLKKSKTVTFAINGFYSDRKINGYGVGSKYCLDQYSPIDGSNSMLSLYLNETETDFNADNKSSTGDELDAYQITTTEKGAVLIETHTDSDVSSQVSPIIEIQPSGTTTCSSNFNLNDGLTASEGSTISENEEQKTLLEHNEPEIKNQDTQPDSCDSRLSILDTLLVVIDNFRLCIK